MRKSDSLQGAMDVLVVLVHQADLVHRVHHHNLQSLAVPTHEKEIEEMQNDADSLI